MAAGRQSRSSQHRTKGRYAARGRPDEVRERMRMSRFARIVEFAGQESGAVLVLFAVFAPVAILLAGFAIDTGNWWLHKRHLQVQADAAALATAQGFQPCANESIYRA